MHQQILSPEPKTNRGRPTLKIPPHVNWTKPNTKIAQEVGVTVMTIIKWRKLLGHKPLNRGRPKVKTFFL